MRRVLLAGSLLAALTMAAPLAAQEQRPTPQHNRELQQHQSKLSRAYLTADADTKGIESAARNKDRTNLVRDVETLGKQLEAARSELSAIEPMATSDEGRYVSEMRSRNADADNRYGYLKSAADKADFAFVLSHILDIRRDVTGAENTRRQMMHQPALQARGASPAATRERPERKPVTRTPVQRATVPGLEHKPPLVQQKAATGSGAVELQRRETAQQHHDSVQAAALQRRQAAEHRGDSLKAVGEQRRQEAVQRHQGVEHRSDSLKTVAEQRRQDALQRRQAAGHRSDSLKTVVEQRRQEQVLQRRQVAAHRSDSLKTAAEQRRQEALQRRRAAELKRDSVRTNAARPRKEPQLRH